jgi:hypothetical protein
VVPPLVARRTFHRRSFGFSAESAHVVRCPGAEADPASRSIERMSELVRGRRISVLFFLSLGLAGTDA